MTNHDVFDGKIACVACSVHPKWGVLNEMRTACTEGCEEECVHQRWPHLNDSAAGFVRQSQHSPLAASRIYMTTFLAYFDGQYNTVQ